MKISLNNTHWTIDTFGYYCENGHDIDAKKHPVKAKFCVSSLYYKMIDLLVSVKKYHEGLISELSNALEKMHYVAADPTHFFENIEVIERDFRETVDIRKQFTLT